MNSQLIMGVFITGLTMILFLIFICSKNNHISKKKLKYVSNLNALDVNHPLDVKIAENSADLFNYECKVIKFTHYMIIMILICFYLILMLKLETVIKVLNYQ